MNRKAKIILAFLLLLAVVYTTGYLSGYSSFSGSYFKRFKNIKTAENHIEKKYPGLRYKILKTDYDYKTGSYFVSMESVSESAVRFNVNVDKNSYVYDNFIESKLAGEAKKFIYPLLKDVIKNDFALDLMVVLKDNYGMNTVYSQDLKLDLTARVNINSTNSISIGDYAALVLKIKDCIVDNKLNIMNLSVSYMVNGSEQYLSSLDKEQFGFTTQEMIESNKINSFK